MHRLSKVLGKAEKGPNACCMKHNLGEPWNARLWIKMSWSLKLKGTIQVPVLASVGFPPDLVSPAIRIDRVSTEIDTIFRSDVEMHSRHNQSSSIVVILFSQSGDVIEVVTSTTTTTSSSGTFWQCSFDSSYHAWNGLRKSFAVINEEGG